MTEPDIRFDDGKAYESFMGAWSRLIAEPFLDWLAPPPGLAWADVGAGNGAFTARLFDHCAASRVEGLDPSEAQLAFARERLAGRPATFVQGDATALPWPDRSFDAAAMALVIFFVPDPARSVSEMARVTRTGGSVSTYAWDILGGGFPYAALQDELRAMGIDPLWPPSTWASRTEALDKLWRDAGLVDVETTELSVKRTFDDFDTWWQIARTGPRLLPRLASMDPEELARLQAGLRKRMNVKDGEPIVIRATANAVKGRVPTK